MAEVSPFAELLGQAIYQFTVVKPLLPMYGHLILSALFPIVISAHASLSRPNSAAKPPKKTERQDGSESEDENDDEESLNDDQKMEGLEPSDALMFPLTAGLTLGGLYLVIKWMGADLLNKILGFYFSQMGIFFAMAFLKDCFAVLRSFIFPRTFSRAGKVWKSKPSERCFAVSQDAQRSEPVAVQHSPLPGIFGSIPLPNAAITTLWVCRSILYWRAKLRIHVHRVLRAECSVGTLDLLSGILALPTVAYFTFVSKPWWLTNFFGFSFCYGTLQFMSPSTFVTGSLILSSLFFYDIYFVYFTPLMVTVAKKLDVPIKLLFPRPPTPSETPGAISLAMLGLGDVIIPGMMVGLALRFDLYLYYKKKGVQKAQAENKDLDHIKPVYQTVTGGWGERFWTASVASKVPKLEPPHHDARSFPKTYFKASIVGYTLGLIATLVVMQIFNHPQPALLYLVPGVLISLWGTALLKNQSRDMWEFTDAEEEEDISSETAKEEEQSKTSEKKMGLFSRILFGNSEAVSSQNSDTGKEDAALDNSREKNEGAVEQEVPQGKDTDKKVEPKDTNAVGAEDLDLFSISLYIPRKGKSQKPGNQEESTKSADENWSFVGTVEKGNEPPAKRIRRSPRKHATAA